MRDDHFQNINERKSNEACPPLPKPIALPQELQTGSFGPNPTGRQDDQSFSSEARRSFSKECMNANHIETKFAAMGARFQLQPTLTGSDFAIDIRRDRAGEFFQFRRHERVRDSVELTVLQTDARDRHLLLLVRISAANKERFLCGHDEREWFVAAVPGTASTVSQAKDALQPRIVRDALRSKNVPSRRRHWRKNDAFRRQGEWFFVPERDLRVNQKFVLRNEPIRRGAGKPHIVAELYREGGEVVYVSEQHRTAATEAGYKSLIARRPEMARLPWRVMRRNASVFARGAIRHSDHATIHLPDWHRVVLNTENETDAMRNVAFLD